jgi:hypothetical protein
MNGVAENYVEGIQGVPLEWREFSAYSNPLRHSHPARGGALDYAAFIEHREMVRLLVD